MVSESSPGREHTLTRENRTGTEKVTGVKRTALSEQVGPSTVGNQGSGWREDKLEMFGSQSLANQKCIGLWDRHHYMFKRWQNQPKKDFRDHPQNLLSTV